MRNRFLIFLLTTISGAVFGQSKAHQHSAAFIIDPAYNSTTAIAEKHGGNGAAWLYGYAELECWRLQVLRKDGIEAKLKVGYPGEYHTAYHNGAFLFKSVKPIETGKISFYTDASVKVLADGLEIYTAPAKSGEQIIILPKGRKISKLEFDLTTNAEPPCLLIRNGPFATRKAAWQWKADNEPWQVPDAFNQLAGGEFPHREKLNEVTVKPVSSVGPLYDFGQELFAYVYIRSVAKPSVCVGESATEAIDTANKVLEQSLEVISTGPGQWRSKVELAFRYVNVWQASPQSVTAGALFYPAQYKGAFASSDTLLNRIWMNSAYTLRLCRNDFLLDGIKRDRLPWAGDLAMSMMVNAYTFADREPVRKSLVVLNRAGIKNQDINGIIDYDLWWIIAQNQYQVYYNDPEHLKRQWFRIKETLDLLNKKCDSAGYIDPKKAAWLFIDWVKFNKNSSLQILWWWAQQSAVEMAKRMGDRPAIAYWQNKAATLKKNLIQNAWDKTQGAWMDDPYRPDSISRHANILAVVSGLAPGTQFEQISKVLLGTKAIPVGTPYMSGFENLALALVGKPGSAAGNISNYWGAMLKQQGTTTFWEAYDPAETGVQVLAYYDRPYAKSLCHAWSSGPAALLPRIILGIHPLTDGWKTFTLNPQLNNLSWISAAIPTPAGTITVDIKGKEMSLWVPVGSTAIWRNEKFKGPVKVLREL